MIKTLIIILLLLPIVVHALKKLYLYVAHFQENKCSGCPHASQSLKKPVCGSCIISNNPPKKNKSSI